MGSYISILNNTKDVWSVKLGPDEAAINIATITSTVVGALAAAVVTGGAAIAPLATSLAANGVVTVCGVSTSVIAATAGAAAAGSAVVAGSDVAAVLAVKLASEIQKQIDHDLGLDRLAPGEKKTYGRMSLSLWQQCMCVRSRVNPDNNREILVEKLYMRPIFSGGTDNSDLTHDIQYWLDKHGVQLVEQKIRLD